MNSKTVKILGAITLLFSAGAWYANAAKSNATGAEGAGDFALPALRDKINEVGALVIETKDGTATIQRSGEQWTLSEKGGFPARESKVRELLMALRSAEIVEQKTSDPEKFPKLGLGDPSDSSEGGSSAKRVTIQDGAGAEIASVLIGDRRAAGGTSGGGFNPGRPAPKAQTYILADKQAPALLVDGQFTVDTRTSTWLDQQLLNVPATRMKAVRVSHPDGETLELHRRDMAEADFEILAVPEGMEPKSPSATRAFMSTLASLRFDDVDLAANIEWPAESVVTSEFFTEHGLRVTMKSIEVEGEDPAPKTWCTIAVDVVDPGSMPGAAPAEPEVGPPVPPVDPTAGSTGTEGDGADSQGAAETQAENQAETAPGVPTQAELKEEAAAIQETVSGWAFALPGWKAGPVRMRPDGVLQAIPPTEEPEEEGTAAEEEAEDGK